VQALAADRRVILFDSAGLGERDGEVPSTFSGVARGAAGLIEAFEPSPADVLGQSIGGMTGQILAIERPELERHTAVIDVIRADI
jgi:pimeloyl-ACP methyl ester carboxylesterase